MAGGIPMNAGDRGPQTLSGEVFDINHSLLKLGTLDGETWHNFSQFGKPLARPVIGQFVESATDRKGFIRTCRVLGVASALYSAPASGYDLSDLLSSDASMARPKSCRS